MTKATMFGAPARDFDNKLNANLRAIQEAGGRIVGVQCFDREITVVAVIIFDDEPEQQK